MSQGHPRHRHQARRPPAQHAHPDGASRRTGASSRRARRWRSTRRIAHRLGISSIKWELEDLLVLSTLSPTKYKPNRRGWSPRAASRREERYLDQVIGDAARRTGPGQHPGAYRIAGRPKHLYSIYHEDGRRRARTSPRSTTSSRVRIIVENGDRDCYSACSARCTRCGTPMPGPLQGLHRHAEVQHVSDACTPRSSARRAGRSRCRSAPRRCTARAEYGVAAHWRYKETGSSERQQGERGPAPRQPARLARRARMAGRGRTRLSRLAASSSNDAQGGPVRLPRCSCSRRRARP